MNVIGVIVMGLAYFCLGATGARLFMKYVLRIKDDKDRKIARLENLLAQSEERGEYWRGSAEKWRARAWTRYGVNPKIFTDEENN